MNEEQKQSNTELITVGVESEVKKVAEGFASRALNAIVDGVKNKYGETQVFLGTTFSRYISNATLRYNQVRTLATGTTPRTLVGQGNIYVSVGVKFEEKIIDTSTVEQMMQISNNILILGTGGIGKSMLMRYLFLNTANRGEYIPVLLELRKVSNQENGKVSILDLIYSCMKDFDIQLPREQFEYSLRLGRYLFLMDGFDEVKECQAAKTAEAIQAFCAKYPKNSCIVTSRPRKDTSPLETFTTIESMPLNKVQAIQLASKIWEADEKTIEFCRQLETGLYEKHRDFAENPLLLSMMFLTFMRNNSVPNHLSEFYGKSFDALYSAHDSNDKGYYRREFRCKNLDESSFRCILSHFCFHTYFKEDYEFSKESILSYIEKSIIKLGFKEIKAIDYLEDLQNVVCLLVKDGDIYRFSHRSFQTYFAACYTSNILTDEQQKKLFRTYLLGADIYWNKEDYYELLSQIEPQRFAVNALEDELRFLREILQERTDADEYFVKLVFNAVSLSTDENIRERISFCVGDEEYKDGYYNIFGVFQRFVLKKSLRERNQKEELIIKRIIRKVNEIKKNETFHEISFKIIDTAGCISDSERGLLYQAIANLTGINAFLSKFTEWLDNLDRQREKLSAADFIDDL